MTDTNDDEDISGRIDWMAAEPRDIGICVTCGEEVEMYGDEVYPGKHRLVKGHEPCLSEQRRDELAQEANRVSKELDEVAANDRLRERRYLFGE